MLYAKLATISNVCAKQTKEKKNNKGFRVRSRTWGNGESRAGDAHLGTLRSGEIKKPTKKIIAKFPLTKCCFPLSGFYYIVRHFVKFLKWHFTKNIFDRKFLSSFGFWLTDFESSSCSPQSLCNRTSQRKEVLLLYNRAPFWIAVSIFVWTYCILFFSLLSGSLPSIVRPSLALSVRVDFVAVHRSMCFDWKRREPESACVLSESWPCAFL